jgi:hypothetical protein
MALEERRCAMERCKVLGKLSLAFVTVLALEAEAATPIFTSGPAFIQANLPGQESFPGTTAVIFGYQNGTPIIVNRWPASGGTGWAWYKAIGTHHEIQGGYDGDPAAIYIPGSLQNYIMTCGHSATPPGYMYCTRLRKADQYHFPTVDGIDVVFQVGWGTFDPGVSPVLVDDGGLGLYLYLFARGMDDQIWYAQYSISGNSWNGWYQVPPPGGHFEGNPGAASISFGHVMVCAHLWSNMDVVCNKMTGGWDLWLTVPNQPATIDTPGLARGHSSLFLFGVRDFVSPNFDLAFTTSPIGGNAGLWGPYVAPVSGGHSLSSGPSAVMNRVNSSPHGMAVARGGDNAFWYVVGVPDLATGTQLVWGGWSQLQTIN